MAIYPGAIVKTVSRFKTPMAAWNRVNLHIAVSEGASLFGYFNVNGNPCSHFYVRRDGVVEQYVDTKYRAAADLDGNDATISIETQGMAQGEWSSAQVKTLAAIYQWCRKTHGIKYKIATDSMIGATSHGLSWHRLGVDPWRRPGSMRYSTARGKICPGDARIAQIPTIFNMSGETQKEEEYIMASKEDLRKVIQEVLIENSVMYRRKGQAAAWADGGTYRRWTGRAVYEARGFPRIVDLEPDDAFWSLPVVGVKPPQSDDIYE